MSKSGKKKILVIDDSETNLLLLQAILEDAGYQVTLLSNSCDAVQIIEQHKPDLVLLDLLMPDMDGFEFMKHLNNGSGSLPAPVLVISAHTGQENNEKARELGALDVINKPIDITSFLNRVNKILN
jgi:CheY-like chemotaxis protein